MARPFKRGNKLAKGGAREGAGRKPDELKARAAEIGDPLEILRFYWNVANGAELEQVVTDAGVSIAVPAPVKDRLRAGELFLDRTIGKVSQGVELGASEEFFEQLEDAIRRGHATSRA